MEYSKEDLMEAKKQILGVGENMGTEESKKIWEAVTSPPYYALRDYGTDGQIGREATPEEYVCLLYTSRCV